MKKITLLLFIALLAAGCENPASDSSSDYPSTLDEIDFDLTGSEYAYPNDLVDGDLLLTFTDAFNFVWNDGGSGLDDDLAVWEPVVTDDYKMLGHLYVGSNGYNPNENSWMPIVKDIGGSESVLAPPEDFTLFYSTTSYNNGTLSFWIPVAPDGYVAMGLYAKTGTEKPDPETSNLVCVNEDYAVSASLGSTYWGEPKFQSIIPVSVFHVQSHGIPANDAPDNTMYIETHCFSGSYTDINAGTTSKTTTAQYVLKINIPVVADHDYSDVFPSLESFDKPDDTSPSNLAKIVAVPFYSIEDEDPNHTLHWQIENSPVYRIRRDTYYKLLLHSYNQSSVAQSESHSYTTGITDTETQTSWESHGVEVSASIGIKILSLGASISEETGFSTESSLSTFEETSVTKNLSIPAGAAAALWQRMNRFTVLVQDEDGTWDDMDIPAPWSIPDNSFVVDDIE